MEIEAAARVLFCSVFVSAGVEVRGGVDRWQQRTMVNNFSALKVNILRDGTKETSSPLACNYETFYFRATFREGASDTFARVECSERRIERREAESLWSR